MKRFRLIVKQRLYEPIQVKYSFYLVLENESILFINSLINVVVFNYQIQHLKH